MDCTNYHVKKLKIGLSDEEKKDISRKISENVAEILGTNEEITFIGTADEIKSSLENYGPAVDRNTTHIWLWDTDLNKYYDTNLTYYNLDIFKTGLDNIVETRHIKNESITFEKLNPNVQNKINQNKENITTINNELKEVNNDIKDINNNLDYNKNGTKLNNFFNEIKKWHEKDLSDKDLSLANYYNKTEIDQKNEQINSEINFKTEEIKTYVNDKLSNTYSYRGSVDSVENLPDLDVKVGDVYDVKDTGMNYAWNGEEWDNLGSIINLDGKQDVLISGENLKTINGESILGSGDIQIESNIDLSDYVTAEELHENYYDKTEIDEFSEEIYNEIYDNSDYIYEDIYDIEDRLSYIENEEFIKNVGENIFHGGTNRSSITRIDFLKGNTLKSENLLICGFHFYSNNGVEVRINENILTVKGTCTSSKWDIEINSKLGYSDISNFLQTNKTYYLASFPKITYNDFAISLYAVDESGKSYRCKLNDTPIYIKNRITFACIEYNLTQNRVYNLENIRLMLSDYNYYSYKPYQIGLKSFSPTKITVKNELNLINFVEKYNVSDNRLIYTTFKNNIIFSGSADGGQKIFLDIDPVTVERWVDHFFKYSWNLEPFEISFGNNNDELYILSDEQKKGIKEIAFEDDMVINQLILTLKSYYSFDNNYFRIMFYYNDGVSYPFFEPVVKNHEIELVENLNLKRAGNVADIYTSDGDIKRFVGSITLNGQESWVIRNSGNLICTNVLDEILINDNQNIIHSGNYEYYNISNDYDDYLLAFIISGKFTVDEWKNFLTDLPIEVNYKLLEPFVEKSVPFNNCFFTQSRFLLETDSDVKGDIFLTTNVSPHKEILELSSKLNYNIEYVICEYEITVIDRKNYAGIVNLKITSEKELTDWTTIHDIHNIMEDGVEYHADLFVKFNSLGLSTKEMAVDFIKKDVQGFFVSAFEFDDYGEKNYEYITLPINDKMEFHVVRQTEIKRKKPFLQIVEELNKKAKTLTTVDEVESIIDTKLKAIGTAEDGEY